MENLDNHRMKNTYIAYAKRDASYRYFKYEM